MLADVLFNERPESGLATFLSIIFVSVSLYIYNVEPPREEVKKPDTEAPGDQA